MLEMESTIWYISPQSDIGVKLCLVLSVCGSGSPPLSVAVLLKFTLLYADKTLFYILTFDILPYAIVFSLGIEM